MAPAEDLPMAEQPDVAGAVQDMGGDALDQACAREQGKGQEGTRASCI
jgi:hypothetical protein